MKDKEHLTIIVTHWLYFSYQWVIRCKLTLENNVQLKSPNGNAPKWPHIHGSSLVAVMMQAMAICSHVMSCHLKFARKFVHCWEDHISVHIFSAYIWCAQDVETDRKLVCVKFLIDFGCLLEYHCQCLRV